MKKMPKHLRGAAVLALLGAAGLGDIGGLFPSGDARWHGECFSSRSSL